MEKYEQEIPIELCPHCGENLIKELSEAEKWKYKVPYQKLKIGISNWSSIIQWQCPYCFNTWKREFVPCEEE